MKRMTVSQLLLRETKGNEGCNFSFTAKMSTIAGSFTRNERTATSRLTLVHCIVIIFNCYPLRNAHLNKLCLQIGHSFENIEVRRKINAKCNEGKSLEAHAK